MLNEISLLICLPGLAIAQKHSGQGVIDRHKPRLGNMEMDQLRGSLDPDIALHFFPVCFIIVIMLPNTLSPCLLFGILLKSNWMPAQDFNDNTPANRCVKSF